MEAFEDQAPTEFIPAPRPVIPESVLRRTSNFMEIYNSKETIEWVIEGLLPTRGLMYVGARSGTGKTILVLQLVVDLLFNRDTMTFKRSKDLPPQKILVLSLEMGEAELRERLRKMYPDMPEDQQKILADCFIFYCDPAPFKLWTSEHVVDLIRLIRKHEVTGVVIDSASVSFATSLKDDSQVNDTISNLYTIRNLLSNWMIIVSHTRKLPAGIVGSMEDVTVDELFGHSGVAQSASSVILMHHDKKGKDALKYKDKCKVVWLMNAKSRFSAEFAPFMTLLPLEPPLQFKRRDPLPLPPLSEEKKAAANKIAKGLDFGESFKAVDFGSIGGIDEA